MELVEQLEVVAHDEDGAVEAGQLVEQPPLGRAVEVVGRLVEDHQLGLLEEHPHEVDPAALAAGERVDVLQEEFLAQAEAVGQSGHDRFGLVAAVALELLLQIGEQLDVLRRRVVGHGARGPCPARRRARRGPGPRGCGRSRSAPARARPARAPGAGTRTSPGGGRCPGGRELGRRSPPPTTEMNDDFPVPFRPTRPTFSPAPTTKEASDSSVRSPISMVRAGSDDHTTLYGAENSRSIHSA